MSKSADAFRTISEVADWLGVQAHVLRFWESKFSQIKPVKRAGGRRYYRPADMLLLGGIQKLLHEDGLSIKEVQTILRDLGVGHVSQLSHDLDADGPPAHRSSTRAASKKSGGAEPKPAYASPDETASEGSAPLNESLPLDPAAAALLSTPATTKADPSQEAAAQETPSEPVAWQESPATPGAGAGAVAAETQPPASTEETTPSVPAASAEIPQADLSVAEPDDQAGVTSAGSEPDLIAASDPAEHAAAEPVADDPISAAPAQMHMELDAPVAAAPEDSVDEHAAAASTPSQDEMSEGGMPDIMPELDMSDADIAPVEEAAQPNDAQNTPPETAFADLAVSPPDDLETQQLTTSDDPLASTEPDQSPMAEDPSAVSPFPANPSPEDPMPKDPMPEDPSPEDPMPEDPLPEDPSPEDPMPEDPLPEAGS
ncbi:MerR family transcriptional regulator [Pseudophaeobacter leonis]|uniref:MerR family transcriptional regulator n=1 Tax=Pseudophaeobacter leonis TaxID=1144477 RepID=UPI0009F60904|nr:MerR family transcriptional regulator [Pseudophaeobacter leonis]